MTTPASRLRRRRAIALVVAAVLPATLVFGLGHRGAHLVRNLLVPGAGLIDERPWVGAAFVVLAVVAIVAWMRWGADWAAVGVTVGSLVVTAASTGDVHEPAALVAERAAHEFPLVVLVVAAIGVVRSAARRVPGLRRLVSRAHRRRTGLADVANLPVRERCLTAAVLALADERVMAASILDDPGVLAAARRTAVVGRLRFRDDGLGRDAALTRAARLLAGIDGGDAASRLATEAVDTVLGAPASAPGWLRPLDATLAVVALGRSGADPSAGERWTTSLASTLAPRRGHRPARWWTPLGVRVGSLDDWEQIATTAIARQYGWLTDDDWQLVRARALGAAARGTASAADERAIAAARLWLAVVDDEPAARILDRPTVCHDPLAVALDRLATLRRRDDACDRIGSDRADADRSAAP